MVEIEMCRVCLLSSPSIEKIATLQGVMQLGTVSLGFFICETGHEYSGSIKNTMER